MRRTQGIVTDGSSSDPRTEADVIMTAAALGLAADYIATHKQPLQFDMDPLDAANPNDQAKSELFKAVVAKMDTAVASYLTKKGLAADRVRAGLSPALGRAR